MRGYPHPLLTKENCIKLRQKGYSLNELVQILKIPKTTAHDWVSHNVILNDGARKRIQQRILNGVLEANRKKRINIPKPSQWSPDLIRTVAHFSFDGYLKKRRGYIYCSRNLSQINRMHGLMLKIFGLKPYFNITNIGIIRSEYSSVELAEYVNKKKKELLIYISTASKEEKRSFLKAFFDDEGAVTFNKNVRKVRGFQYSKKILKLVQNLLKDFGIKSHIDKRITEIAITSKENLIRFKNEINFSSKIYINPKRKNGIWKYKIDKRTILEKAINSYQI